jgi:hypothetical protein
LEGTKQNPDQPEKNPGAPPAHREDIYYQYLGKSLEKTPVTRVHFLIFSQLDCSVS